ncbi:olfactory receptor 14A16-like [Dromiciops gliroides]|uniref:olfactory receptor 14A16-like n=1 Tax=Dromiciops gliroides TaxID=33562 RepID=UPI001CC5AD57|nr:olfactory receptor 14A16-like [Dromiciops gliroides]
MTNATLVTEFILIGFSEVRELQILHALLFLLIYLVALLGNLLIIVLTILDKQLHTPMYFFLKHLSFLDLCYISVTVPKFISNTLANSNSISFLGCLSQVFLVVFLACTELALLTVMSYDRYVAICNPLHYAVIMKRRTCVKMAASLWFSGGISGLLHTATGFSLPFCESTKIHQFFCEIPQILRLSCSDNYSAEVGALAITSSLSFVCFLSISISYIHIFSTVLKIPSVVGRSKAFSTCLPHLIVVTVFLNSAAVAYLKPTSTFPSSLDILVSVFYTVLPPTLNPIIYSLRNKDMKTALRKLVRRSHQFSL